MYLDYYMSYAEKKRLSARQKKRYSKEGILLRYYNKKCDCIANVILATLMFGNCLEYSLMDGL